MKGEKIVNIGMNIGLIMALALAATGSSTKYQVDVSNSNAPVRGQNLNHNQTLVRDAAPTQRADDWSLWVSSEQSFPVAPLLIQFSFYWAGPGCSKWVCGANHNETLVRDTATPQRADDWSLWLSSEQSFAVASLLIPFSIYRAGAGCSKWVCGSNHNETLVRDTPQSQQSDTWNLLMSGEQSFAASSLLIQFSFYRIGAGCSHWHCNNETPVRNAAR